MSVVCGGLAAGPYLLVLAGSTGSMILFYLAQLPLFAAGLWLGTGAAAAAGLVAALILAGGRHLVGAGPFFGVGYVSGGPVGAPIPAVQDGPRERGRMVPAGSPDSLADRPRSGSSRCHFRFLRRPARDAGCIARGAGACPRPPPRRDYSRA